MRPGETHTLTLTTEQLGYVDMCCRQALKKDRKGSQKFGDALDMESSLAHRLRVGGDVEDLVSLVRDGANHPQGGEKAWTRPTSRART